MIIKNCQFKGGVSDLNEVGADCLLIKRNGQADMILPRLYSKRSIGHFLLFFFFLLSFAFVRFCVGNGAWESWESDESCCRFQ